METRGRSRRSRQEEAPPAAGEDESLSPLGRKLPHHPLSTLRDPSVASRLLAWGGTLFFPVFCCPRPKLLCEQREALSTTTQDVNINGERRRLKNNLADVSRDQEPTLVKGDFPRGG